MEFRRRQRESSPVRRTISSTLPANEQRAPVCWLESCPEVDPGLQPLAEVTEVLHPLLEEVAAGTVDPALFVLLGQLVRVLFEVACAASWHLSIN